jgi:hypothetical protein
MLLVAAVVIHVDLTETLCLEKLASSRINPRPMEETHMADPLHYPGSEPDRDERIPRWIKVSGIVLVLVILAVVLVMVIGGGGEHGPRRH